MYRAGIIGTGGIAGMGVLGLHDASEIGQRKVRTSHAGGYDATEAVELVAVADVDEAALETFGEAWDIPPEGRYVGHRAMLESESLDVVSVCTPTDLHHRHVVDAATSAANPDVVWCEKPIAASVADANDMVSTCRQEGVELVVNHSFRFTDKLRHLETLLRERALVGEVHAVSAQFRMELLRNATHLLDTLVYLLDAPVARVSGFVNGENEAVESLDAGRRVDDAGGGGFLVLDDGTFATIDCTVPRAASSMQIQLVGENGKLYLNNDDGEWRYWRLEDGEHVEADLPGIDGGWTWEEDYREAFPNAAGHVVDLLDGEAENHSTGEAATRSLEIIVGFYCSHYVGGHVDLPLEPPLEGVEITSW